VIRYLREHAITLTYDPAAGTLHAGTAEAAKTITVKASRIWPEIGARSGKLTRPEKAPNRST